MEERQRFSASRNTGKSTRLQTILPSLGVHSSSSLASSSTKKQTPAGRKSSQWLLPCKRQRSIIGRNTLVRSQGHLVSQIQAAFIIASSSPQLVRWNGFMSTLFVRRGVCPVKWLHTYLCSMSRQFAVIVTWSANVCLVFLASLLLSFAFNLSFDV